MFVETAIACFALGALAGMVYAYYTAIRPVDRMLDEQRRTAQRALRQSLYREEARRAAHRGTPYIAPLPNELERALVDIASVPDVGNDHDTSSLRADLRVVS